MIQGDIFLLGFPHFLYFVLAKQNLLKVNLSYLIYRILGTCMHFKHVSFLKQKTGYTEKHHPGKQYGHFGSKKKYLRFYFS